ncbi:MAG: type IX secretion system sortase PorU [Sphingobacteriaceae bacterium]|nr:type IX secretion system sortase PorU [Sphingobacteriaceae bacterium]
MKLNKLLCVGVLFLIPFMGMGQDQIELKWSVPTRHEIDDQQFFNRLNCLNCTYSGKMASVPTYFGLVSANVQVSLEVEAIETVPVAERAALDLSDWPGDFEVSQQLVTIKKQRQTHYQVKAVRRNPSTGQLERLLRFRIRTTAAANVVESTVVNQSYASNSVLASGSWFKIGIARDGIYRLNASTLSSMGFIPGSFDPRNLRIYGNGGGMLPEANAAFRHDDLVENPILVFGESDGSFDANDYVLFYGEGAHKWRFDITSAQYRHEYNLYADTNYYFVTVGNGPGKRLQTAATAGPATATSTSYDVLAQHQRDERNLIRSGRRWYGELFDLTLSHSFNFQLPNLLLSEPVRIRTAVAARSLGAASSFVVRANGNVVNTVPVSQVTSYYLDLFMRDAVVDATFNASSSNVAVNIAYNKPNNFSQGWLDFIELQGRADLNLNNQGGFFIFSDKNSVAAGQLTQFDIAGIGANQEVWDVTHIANIQRMPLSGTGRGAAFVAATDSLRTFIAFAGSSFPEPALVGQVGNQNLHANANVNMVIVAPAAFLNQANQLASLHLQRNNITSLVVTPTEIYNEFSSGRQDITAIRALVKMLYDRATPGNEPRFLLLLGSASYDYKHRLAGNANWVPTFQSPNSNDPLNSYCADSYFGLLDNHEGAFSVGGSDRMDVAIGRLPAKNVQQAQQMVDKIQGYLDAGNSGDWKNHIMLVADDEDGNLHLNDTEAMAGHINTRYPVGRIQKVYFDAYPQVSRPGGTRYPEVNRDINARMNLGALIVGYMGHGGINGWAEERVLTIPEIQAWNSGSKLPMMLTATCEFTRYDNPTFTSAGEWVLLNPVGGAIALMTTTRVTFTNFNFSLSTRVYRDELFRRSALGYQTLGEVFMNAANPELSNVNTRNFCLLGDPALTLAFPEEVAAVTSINNVQVNPVPDTLRALARVTITGDMRDQSNQLLSNYNGVLTPTVLDKPSQITTQVNDPGSRLATYSEFRNIIYRGRATITNGQWSFTFIVPRDIAYNYGFGRINLYATNNSVDAAGDFRNVIVGGTDTNFVPDALGPEIKLFMNDRSFVNGGITDQNPVFFAQLSDSSGINTVGSGIGRDITLIKNQEVNSPIILNQFYEASLDDYTRGEIRYPFFRLDAGNYTLNMKVWDVHNNSGEASLDFVVAEDAKLAIDNLLNYPNPFTTSTTFHFDHNRPNQPLEAILQVYTVSGKLVKSIQQTILTPGFHADQLHWDGLDDFGDRIGRGVYIYRLRLRSTEGESVQETQKLVILR